ncbi:MAG TPA: endonuclease/exonuclease/phosphatase family protein [Candidatus Woesebacteria bacterium]|nr:endonuclease/exonuclease/phosphatase family protein [Candidatus Woesebacteria bacterium]HNS94968.1 endonuclease/exonuclease/phosphatase family protein [Candidatus Woesebacteria bacterium]
MIRILSYNVRYGRKLSQILAWLQERYMQYDVICLQEYPQDKQKDIRGHFASHYQHVFSHGFSTKKGSFGQVTLYDTIRLKTHGSRVLTLGKNAIEDIVHGIKGERTALITKLKNGEGSLSLINTHLACLAGNGARRKQLKMILDELKHDKAHAASGQVVVGDFNYTSLLRQRSLLSFMTDHHFINAYKKSTHRLFFVKHQLDYAFYRQCAIRNVMVERLKYSDHYPVSFEVHFPHAKNNE